MNAATEFDTCPRCGSFELVVGEDGSGCLVCGFVRDGEGDLPLPHYSLRYIVHRQRCQLSGYRRSAR